MQKKSIQPAKENYFFWTAYKNLLKIFVSCYKELGAYVVNDFALDLKQDWTSTDKFTKKAVLSLRAIRQAITILVMYTLGSVFFSAAFIVHSVIIVPITFLIFLFFMLIRAIDRVYLLLNGIFIACPKCKEKSRIPTYICSSCGEKHTKLYPGKYGIFHRVCKCGNKLPTMNINGRRLLQAECSSCGHPIKSKEATPICIPIIGSPSVGKTSYIGAAMKELVQIVPPVTGISLTFYDEDNKRRMSELLKNFSDGYRQRKTDERNPLAFNFFLQGKKILHDKLLYIYDIAGEAFHEQNVLMEQKQYEYCHGFIFLIDPLTISSIRERYKDEKDYTAYDIESSKTDVNDTIDAFLLNLKRLTNLSANELSKVPCAIVINKIDEFDLEQLLGQPAVDKYLSQEGNKLTDKAEIIDQLTREYLLKNGLSNFISQIDTQFKNNRYFTCSAQGHRENGTEFDSIRVLEPLEWIISLNDRTLKKELGRYVRGTYPIRFPRKKITYSGTVYTVLDTYKDGDDKYMLLGYKNEDTGIFNDKFKVMLKKKNNKLSLKTLVQRTPIYTYSFLSPSDFSQNSEAGNEIKKNLHIENWKVRINYILNNVKQEGKNG